MTSDLATLDHRPRGTPSPAPGSVALALGAGGARGIAHIVVLEALDELGIRPVAIAGSSMGAILGAAYAAGLSGRELRDHTLLTLKRRHRVMAQLFEARVGRFAELFTRGLANPVLVDAEVMLRLFWPEAVPERFEELAVPFMAVTTDFFARNELVLSSGELRSAVAGSMAIPGLVRPVLRNGRTLVDGGAVNPLPCNLLAETADIVIACDIIAGPVSATRDGPSPFEAMFGAAQIMQAAIAAKMLKSHPPHILIRPPVDGFRALDFFQCSQILSVAEGVKDEIKRDLDRVLAQL